MPLDFVRVVIGDGIAFLDPTQARRGLGVEEERLRQRRLPRTAVPKQSNIADAIGGILAQVHRSPPLNCDPSRIDELMPRHPRPPRGRSGAVGQVTLAMVSIIGRKPLHPQPLSFPSPYPSIARNARSTAKTSVTPRRSSTAR